MILFALTIIFGILLSIFNGTTCKVIRNFNVDVTSSLQIVLAVLVVLAHLSQQLKVGFLRPFTSCGGVAVSIFFFISGYGLMKSLLYKENYLNGFILKRMPKVLVPFIISSLLYWLLYYAKGVSLSGIPFAESEFHPFALPYSWFIEDILLFYIVFFVSAKFRNGRCDKFVWIIISLISILQWSLGVHDLLYLSSMCFPLGLSIAKYEMPILNWLGKYKMISYGMIVVLTTFSFVLPTFLSRIAISLTAYLACAFFYCPTYITNLFSIIRRFKITRISYEYYLTQGCSMIILKSVFGSSNILYVVGVILLNLALSGGGILGV